MDPIQPFLAQQGFAVLDGGLATELEVRGCDIEDPLWSAKVLLEEPALIQAVSYDYLTAGADCIVSASYQATVERLESRGLDKTDALDTIVESVRIAIEARDRFWSDPANRVGRIRPLVAASVGPYGAFLADGSEYDGRYGLTVDDLIAFHRERWLLLAGTKPDLMACETIPSSVETVALLHLMRETPGVSSMISFSCSDADRLCDGSALTEAVREANESEHVVAIGVNCVRPSLVAELITNVRTATDKPVAVYPNSGEEYDATTKTWSGIADPVDFGTAVKEWRRLGASVIGGCCRTGPEHVRAIRRAMG